MPKKRCFSESIVSSDVFLNLPFSAQVLYYQLNMSADDRGYVNNAKSIIRFIGAKQKDLDQLIEKRFVLKRTHDLILIKGWRLNNSIQPSKLIETRYIDDLNELYYDENNSYTESITDKKCIEKSRQKGGESPDKRRTKAGNKAEQYNTIQNNTIEVVSSIDKSIPDTKENIITNIKESDDSSSNHPSVIEWNNENVSKALELEQKVSKERELTDDEVIFLNQWRRYQFNKAVMNQ